MLNKNFESLKNYDKSETGADFKRRNVSYMPWWEVIREKDVFVVGDLHGCFTAFEKNIEAVQVTDSNGEWAVGNSELVFLGDILSDIKTQGLDIIHSIHNLRSEARKYDGDITVLTGNHDDWMISLLMGVGASSPEGIDYQTKIWRARNTWDIGDACINNLQGMGITELMRFLPDIKSPTEDNKYLFESLTQLKANREKVLRNMQNDEYGKIILEEMCKMKILEHIDDTLFLHTNPTVQMMDWLLTYGVDAINEAYQSVLNHYLLGRGDAPTIHEWKLFEDIREVFLYTGNRHNFDDAHLAIELSAKGINHILHGHNGQKGKTIFVGGCVGITDLDYQAFKSLAHDSRERRSVGIIHAGDGRIYAGANGYQEQKR